MSLTLGSTKKNAIKVTKPWLEWLARLGHAAKGAVYFIIGILAIQVTLGTGGGETNGTSGAFQTILEQPFGRILLGVVALGFVGYALWMFARAMLKSGDSNSDVINALKRIGYAGNGLVHLGLAFVAGQMVMGNGGGSGNSTQEWTARLMEQPFGRWVVGLVGLVLIGVGLYRLYQAYTTKFREELALGEMDATEKKWTIRVGKAGLAAQGVVFGMLGGFLIQAAVQYQPEEARGLGGALRSLLDQPFGPWLLGIVAAGLMAHGVYMFIQARYRRIEAAS